jgi:hypothetical protein
MVIAASLAGVVAAQAQGVGFPPGVNPSNPQDLTYRSNPQDLVVPGGSNRQDLVRPSPKINGPLPNLGQPGGTSVSPQILLSPGLQYTVKSKPRSKSKRKPRHHVSAAQR